MKKEQKIVDQWIKKFGVRYFSEQTNTILLMEEVGEFSRYIARVFGEQSFKKGEEKEQAMLHIKEEIGDILFVILCLANQMNIDLDLVFNENIEKKNRRDQQRHIKNKKLM